MQDWSIISSAAGTIPAAIIADTASPAVLILLKSASSVLIARGNGDRKSTRLNSSHSQISYAVFCLKKKKKKIHDQWMTQTLADFEHRAKVSFDGIGDNLDPNYRYVSMIHVTIVASHTVRLQILRMA